MKSVSIALIGGLLLSQSVSAYVLDFSGNICDTPNNECNTNDLILQAYGDVTGVIDVRYANVEGEPGIGSLHWWNALYNDLQGVAFTNEIGGISRARVEFAPLQAGTLVALTGLDLGSYLNEPISSVVKIFDLVTGATLYDSGTVALFSPTNVHTHFAPNVSSPNGLALEWGPSAFNAGIDNVQYNVVPEPGTYALLMAGLVLLASSVRLRHGQR